MARNLARAVCAVSAWNRTADMAAALAEDGVSVADTARLCVADADSVFIVLSDGPASDRLLFGDGGVARWIRPGATVVVMSSIARLEEQASEPQSLIRILFDDLCLQKKK